MSDPAIDFTEDVLAGEDMRKPSLSMNRSCSGCGRPLQGEHEPGCFITRKRQRTLSPRQDFYRHGTQRAVASLDGPEYDAFDPIFGGGLLGDGRSGKPRRPTGAGPMPLPEAYQIPAQED